LKRIVSVCGLLLAGAVSTAAGAATEVLLQPGQDNTLYETSIDSGETVNERSNGAGNFLFAGRTGFDAGFRLRRAVLKFDLGDLPPDAEILSAELTLYQSKSAPGSPPAEMGLHRVLQAWGEGTSKGIAAEGQGDFPADDDATWHHSLYPGTLWDTAGGNYDSTASAVVTVGPDANDYTWECTQALVADVSTWLQQPELNFGWIVVGGEVAGYSAHRFNSRENATTETRPRLKIVYRTAGSVFGDGFEAAQPCD